MFILNGDTRIRYGAITIPVENAVEMLHRDMRKVFAEGASEDNFIVLLEDAALGEEEYRITTTNTQLTIQAADDLGFIYGLLHISEKYLGIKPFWFWMDQQIPIRDRVEIEEGEYASPKYAVKYRGWFFNDEVLINKWNINGDKMLPWKMAYEALLRCGGNMAIPGTDKIGIHNRRLASDMGLWITHHHAEPLGAEMFTRAFPGKNPNYMEHKELFHQIWEEAVIAQKDMKVIYNVGFRGQGDCPFWSSDNSNQYDTNEKRGRLISELIELQKNIVKKHVEKPVFCTNLYGEIMELYSEGCVELGDDIIKIYADNGFGKMVSRRRDNHLGGVEALPQNPEDTSGIYYHVSFYDLQAANHLNMLPNSVQFVNDELNLVRARNAMEYWIINCSNVRPHVYYLDAVRKKWCGQEINDEIHSKEFVSDYYGSLCADEGHMATSGVTKARFQNEEANYEDIAWCYENHYKIAPAYGSKEYEHAGEQYYTENVRMFVTHLVRNQMDTLKDVVWCTGERELREQLRYFGDTIRAVRQYSKDYHITCSMIGEKLAETEKERFKGTLLLNADIHYYCAEGFLAFEQACYDYFDKEYKKAFLGLGKAAQWFDKADAQLHDTEYDVWKGFYSNDCFADIKHTAYMVRKLMGIVREYGDNIRHDMWYREATYEKEDQEVYTQLVLDNHMEDWELFEAMLKRRAHESNY